MPDTRRSKRVILLEKIMHRIISGELPSGSEFPSIRELSGEYGISDRTACAIIHDLSQKGFLELSQGRRSRVRSTYAVPSRPRFCKPVAIVSAFPELLHVRWREWLCERLRRRLQEDGIQSLELAEDFIAADVAEAYSGCIIAGEQLSEDKWEMLQATGLPCVRLSFFRPHPDTIFVDYRVAMDEVALYLAARQCRKVILLGTCERDSNGTFNWYGQIGFLQSLQDYRVDEKGFYRTAMSAKNKNCMTEIKSQILASPDKTAFLALETSSCLRIAEMMQSCRRMFGVDYEIVSLCRIPGETPMGGFVDMKGEEIADKMLEILYRRQITGEQQLSKIIRPKFCEGS